MVSALSTLARQSRYLFWTSDEMDEGNEKSLETSVFSHGVEGEWDDAGALYVEIGLRMAREAVLDVVGVRGMIDSLAPLVRTVGRINKIWRSGGRVTEFEANALESRLRAVEAAAGRSVALRDLQNLFRGYLDGQDWFGRIERDQKREVAAAEIVGQGESAGGVCSAHPPSTAAPGLHPSTPSVMAASALTPTTPDTRSCINSTPAHHFAPGVVPTPGQEASNGLCWPTGSKGDIEREMWDEGRVRYWWFLSAIEWNHCIQALHGSGVMGAERWRYALRGIWGGRLRVSRS